MCRTSRVCLWEENEAVLERSGFPGTLQVPGTEWSVAGGLENRQRSVHTLRSRASRLFHRPISRAALGRRCHRPHWAEEGMRFIHSFLGSFTHSPHLGQMCTKPQDTVAHGGAVLWVPTGAPSSPGEPKQFAQWPGELRRGARVTRLEVPGLDSSALLSRFALAHVRALSKWTWKAPTPITQFLGVLSPRGPHPVPRKSRAPQELIS